MEAVEAADDQYAIAAGIAVQAKADYLRARSMAIVELIASGVKGVSDRNEQADADCLKEHEAHLFAESAERVALQHVRTELGLLVAAQSQQKHHGRADGGTQWGDFDSPPGPGISEWR
jgi:hypothetical protein